MVRYAILGPVELRDGDRRLATGGPRQTALLALLLVRANRATAIDVLVDVLWGDERSARAVKRLQVAVTRLRQALGPDPTAPSPLRTVSGGYLLAVVSGELDADVFERRTEDGRRAHARGDPVTARAALREALALWRGPALAEVAYEPFAQAEIRRLEELRLGALEARLDADLELGEHERVIAELEGLIAAHPSRERLVAQLMLAHYRCGRQTDALELYRRAQVTLNAEFGLQPGPALAALQRQVLDHAVPPTPASSSQGAGSRDRRPPPPLRAPPERAFVGRVEECARLAQAVRSAAEGRMRAVLIGGEPGVGKTRLALHTAQRAYECGFAVGWGTCVEDVNPPYGPWGGALSQLVDQAQEAVLARHVAEHGGELARLAPSLQRRLDGARPLRRSDPESERFLLFASVAGLLDAACDAGPVALVLDDLAWANKDSLDLLRYVATTASADLPLLIVATYRDTDLRAGHPLVALLADLHRVEAVTRMHVAGLGVDDVAELMAPSAARELDAEQRRLVGELVAETGGNPFFVGELVRHLREIGADRLPPGAPLASLGLPQSVREVILRRVCRLGATAEHVLTVGAVVGQSFDMGLLERITATGEEATLAALEAATDGALLVEAPEAVGRFTFAHGLISHALYTGLSATRRVRLHRRAAEVLEETPDPDAGELALHWARAGVPARASDYAQLAGERALAHIALDEALRWFMQALDLRLKTDAHAAALCDVLIGLGEAKRRLGETTFRHNLLKASRIAARLGDHERLTRAVLANTLGPFGAAGPPDRLRVQTLERALDQVPADWPWRAQMMAILARELYLGGEPGRGAALSVRALARSRRLSDRGERAKVIALTSLVSPIDSLETHAEVVRELTELAHQIGDPELRFRAASAAFLYGMHAGEPEPLARGVDAMQTLAAAIGQPILLWTSIWARSTQRTLMGDLSGGEALALQAAAAARDQRRPQGFLITFGQLLSIRAEQDRLDELRAPLDQLLARNPRLPVLRLATGFIDAETGWLDRAAAVLAQVAAEGFEFPFDRTLAFSLARCADIALRVRAYDLAGELYDRLLPHRAQFATPAGVSSRGAVELALGRLASFADHHDVALEHLAAAERAHERLGAPLLQARTSLAWGEALLARGEPGPTAERLTTAVDLARAHGSVALEREAQARLALVTPAGRH